MSANDWLFALALAGAAVSLAFGAGVRWARRHSRLQLDAAHAARRQRWAQLP